MDTQGTASRFKTTSWTLILRAASGPRDLETLLQRYRWPVYAYLRRKGRSQADADDLTQGFLCDVLLERNLLQRADQNRGKFRSFLLKSLENYLVDKKREEAGRKGSRPKTFAVEDPVQFCAAEPLEQDNPQDAYDRQWATTVFELAVERVERKCATNGMQPQWSAFEERVRRPHVYGCKPTPVEELMARFGARRRSEIDSMLQTIKRKIEDEMLAVLEETVDNPLDAEDELRQLRWFIGF